MEEVQQICGCILALVLLIIILPTMLDAVRSDFVSSSEHEEIVSDLESNLTKCQDEKHLLNQRIKNFSENRSDLVEERDFYEEKTENLSIILDEKRNKIEEIEAELNKEILISNLSNYSIRFLDYNINFILSLTFVIVLPALISIKIFKIKIKVPIKGYKIDLDNFLSINNAKKLYKIVKEKKNRNN